MMMMMCSSDPRVGVMRDGEAVRVCESVVRRSFRDSQDLSRRVDFPFPLLRTTVLKLPPVVCIYVGRKDEDSM